MAKWGRRHYGIAEPDDRRAIKLLAVVLMGKEQNGAFKKVRVLKEKKLKSRPTLVALPPNIKAYRPKKKRDDFYESWEWRKVRYMVLQEHGAKCMLCGATPKDGAKICVDHIKPRAVYPELELDPRNLQVLCDECNMGKGRWDQTDWRETKVV